MSQWPSWDLIPGLPAISGQETVLVLMDSRDSTRSCFASGLRHEMKALRNGSEEEGKVGWSKEEFDLGSLGSI